MANALVLFGFCWMVVAAIIGFLLAKRHEVTLEQLAKLAAKNNLAEYHRVNDGYKWNKTIHAHAFLFSVVAVCIGLAMPRMNFAPAITEWLAIGLIVSAVVWTIGGVRSNRPLMVLGDVSLLLSIGMAAVGMAKTL